MLADASLSVKPSDGGWIKPRAGAVERGPACWQLTQVHSSLLGPWRTSAAWREELFWLRDQR
jgi:hypothetical protein